MNQAEPTGLVSLRNLSIQDHNLSSQGGRDIFVLQVDENGTVLWARSFGEGK